MGRAEKNDYGPKHRAAERVSSGERREAMSKPERRLIDVVDLLDKRLRDPMNKLALVQNLCFTGEGFRQGFAGLGEEDMTRCGRGLSAILEDAAEAYFSVRDRLGEMLAEERGSEGHV